MADARDTIVRGFLKHLNSHGYGFQESVTRELFRLHKEKESDWRPVFVEYPVQFRDRPLAIDVLLENRKGGNQIMVVECKRADPAVNRWCFARTPFIDVGRLSAVPVIAGVIALGAAHSVRERTLLLSGEPYDVGFELKTGGVGDGIGRAQSALDGAHAQVLRGAAGLIEQLVNEPHLLLSDDEQVAIVPAIVTTAEIFVTDANLSDADLLTGDLPSLEVTPVPWLWYQKHVSRDLLPKIAPQFREGESRDLRSTVRQRHTRAVAVVSATGIGDFAKVMSMQGPPVWL